MINEFYYKVKELQELSARQGIPLIMASVPNKELGPLLYAISVKSNQDFFHLLTNLTAEYLERTGQKKTGLGVIARIITDQLKERELTK